MYNFFVPVSLVFSQQIRHIVKVEGLNPSQAYNFIQDKDGFIWISTKYGISRFDGSAVKNYNFDILNSVRNPIREVHIVCDKDSLIWAYADNGIIKYYDNRNDNFVNFYSLKSYLKTVYIDEKNTIWLGMNFSLGRIVNRRITIFNNSKLDFNMVRKILPFNQNKLIIVTSNSVLLFDKIKCSFTELNQQISSKVLTFLIETAY